eukprot:CAMPEP_0117053268 /NCGR_PEP_ID=MMETSP0472-20121206/36834_1 /TAXON_ID=693140 ORGANISM="Tiarina fusus, Strain LIS" /NCGR_SAMPLE_ID=MMETSP0472 /ASSEMBLY_ACC=CAM_ASM_000603 /LENGTH=123 /DNA_ID=CAMNT_0004768239 /DNA_START=122 /DNA_END=490 /DNA_ORIENTATION=-
MLLLSSDSAIVDPLEQSAIVQIFKLTIPGPYPKAVKSGVTKVKDTPSCDDRTDPGTTLALADGNPVPAIITYKSELSGATFSTKTETEVPPTRGPTPGLTREMIDGPAGDDIYVRMTYAAETV